RYAQDFVDSDAWWTDSTNNGNHTWLVNWGCAKMAVAWSYLGEEYASQARGSEGSCWSNINKFAWSSELVKLRAMTMLLSARTLSATKEVEVFAGIAEQISRLADKPKAEWLGLIALSAERGNDHLLQNLLEDIESNDAYVDNIAL